MVDAVPTSFGSLPKSEYPKVPKAQAKEAPIDMLGKNAELHSKVLAYLNARITASENAMTAFYPRWSWNEKRIQAYIDLPNYEKVMKEANRTGEPPKVTSITLPYAYATIATIVTYLIQVFAGRKPIFQLDCNNPAYQMNARNMEIMLQYNADHVRLIKNLFQFFNDGELYGLAVLGTQWRKDSAKRTKIIERPVEGFLSAASDAKLKIREDRIIFEGTHVRNIDPYCFFPDPRVPMTEVARRGEYVFWRSYEGKHTLKKMESNGDYKYVAQIPAGVAGKNNAGQSSRALLSEGDPNPGGINGTGQDPAYIQLDQGTIDIIPAELGLGESTGVERWIFAIGNKGRIIQAEPIELDHGMHPVVVAEPYSLGYGFGQAGLADYLGPLQETVSWYVNSHIHNVRASLNNMFVVDPSMVEMQDVKNPGPAKIIRLKRSAYGQDVRGAISQLPVADVTRGHVADLDVFMRIGDAMSAINDNLRGLQDAGGRKSATEARTSSEAAASRLASHAKKISSQAIIDLAFQMTMNYQQFMSMNFFLDVMGDKALESAAQISAEILQGDFVFPISDGTLPLDRVAMLDVWKEVMIAVMGDQELRQAYSVPKMFEFVAELGGAKNLEQMKLQPQQAIDAQVAAGNMVPVGAGTAVTPGVQPNPGERLIGGF